MPIHRKQNQYRGVNAHLQSHFQRRGGWPDFHRAHMDILTHLLSTALAPHPAYSVHLENSLQVAHYDLYMNELTTSPRTADSDEFVRVRDLADVPVTPSRPTRVLPVTNLFLEEEEEVTATVIYRENKAITRLEMLSPASLLTGSHHHQYLVRRSQSLCNLTTLVELAYLHERRPPIPNLPDYTGHEKGAHPYGIFVTEMRSPIGPGQVEAYTFSVEDPIPVVMIPLAEGDVLTFDFGMAYHQAFEIDTRNGQRYVNYEALPDGFKTYAAPDQTRIKARMEMVAAQQRGDNDY
ncbi:MAG: hypothetical protein OHK0046_47110 [Anaerolineae bacterium]